MFIDKTKIYVKAGAGGNGGANDIGAGDTNIGGSGSEENGEAVK